MNIKIFTLLTLGILFSTLASAQPLSGSPLPDTIFYKLYGNPQSREIIKYDDTKKITSKSYWNWNTSSKKYIFDFEDVYSYNNDSKISKIASTKASKEFFYNSVGLDSLHIFTNVTEDQWTGTKIYNFLYNQNKDTISISETNSNADSTYLYRLDEYQYNSNNKKEFWYLKNKYGKFKTEYYYYDDGKLERTDSYTLDNGVYKGNRRFSYTYNADNKINEIKIYAYSQNTQTWNYTYQKHRFIYSDTSIIKNTYYNDVDISLSLKEIFNHQGQIVVSQEENYSNVVNKFNTTKLDSTYYNSDGSLNRIVRKEGNIHAQDNILILVTSDEYRYKKPEINSTNSTLLTTSISVFPNPASESVTITLPDDLQVSNATLYNTMGEQVNQYFPSSTTFIIEKHTKPAGNYYLKLTTNEGIVTKPIVFIE